MKAIPISIDQQLREAERRRLVDEFGELDRKVKQFAPIRTRHEALAREIRGWYEQHPADQSALVSGTAYDLQVGERGEERQFSPKAKATIFKELGKAAAMSLFHITLKAAEAALGEQRVSELVTLERTGSRKLVPVAKAPIVAVEKAA